MVIFHNKLSVYQKGYRFMTSEYLDSQWIFLHISSKFLNTVHRGRSCYKESRLPWFHWCPWIQNRNSQGAESTMNWEAVHLINDTEIESWTDWWFGTWILFFHNNYPNWPTHIFQRGEKPPSSERLEILPWAPAAPGKLPSPIHRLLQSVQRQEDLVPQSTQLRPWGNRSRWHNEEHEEPGTLVNICEEQNSLVVNGTYGCLPPNSSIDVPK